MKVNELQIGDYVNYRGQIIKVTSLYDKGGSNEVGWSDKESVWVNGRCIEPIPLTPEILEKNGIKWLSTEPSGRRTYCCNKPVIHCTYFPNSGWLVCVGACGSNKVRFVEISKVQHVHQLQHALRLYGIEKEIEL